MPPRGVGVGAPTGGPAVPADDPGRSGPIYLRHRTWFWSNRDNPEFWAEWERRFHRSEAEGTVENRAQLGLK